MNHLYPTSIANRFRRQNATPIAIIAAAILAWAIATPTATLAQTIAMSGQDQPVQVGSPATLSVSYETTVAGIVQIQLIDSNWNRIADKFENIESGNGQTKLSIEVPTTTNPANNYRWQVLLYDRQWKKLAEDVAGDVVVTSKGVAPKVVNPADAKPSGTDEVSVTPTGVVIAASEEMDSWVPPGLWNLEWADEFSGKGEPEDWYPLLGYNPDEYKQRSAKGIRWSGDTEESAWMYSTKTGNHRLTGTGQMAMRIVCDKTDTNEHGPKVNAAYLLTGYPDQWDKNEPNNVKWAGKFFSPAEGPLYLSARVRTDKVVGYSTWFAFWLFTETRAYNGNPADGSEVDVVEVVKGKPEYMSHCFNVANHWKKSGGSESKQFNAASRPRPQAYVDVNDDQYHTYGVEWSREAMKCYVDGKLFYTFTENIPTDPVDMMILLTLEFKPNSWDPHQGDGRTEGPFVSDTPDMREMSRVLVDHVRVFRQE